MCRTAGRVVRSVNVGHVESKVRCRPCAGSGACGLQYVVGNRASCHYAIINGRNVKVSDLRGAGNDKGRISGRFGRLKLWGNNRSGEGRASGEVRITRKRSVKR